MTYNTTYDTNWMALPTFVFAVLETNLAIVAASVPALKPLYVEYFIPLISRYSGNRQRYFGRPRSKSVLPNRQSGGEDCNELSEFSSTTAIGSFADGSGAPCQSARDIVKEGPMPTIFPIFATTQF